LLDALPVGPLSGFEFGDGQLMAAGVDLAGGDLAGAAAHAEALAGDRELCRSLGSGPWRPWYAALRAGAAVLDHHPEAADRIDRSRRVARDNPITTAMIQRAAAIATDDRDTLVRLAITFAKLGCPYQQARTGRIAAGPLARRRQSR
jgi:hypothetical protein